MRARFDVVLTNVLEQADVDRIGEIRMEVEQHVDAGFVGRANGFQDFGRLRVVSLRAAQIDIDAPQSFRDRPLETPACASGASWLQSAVSSCSARGSSRVSITTRARGCVTKPRARVECQVRSPCRVHHVNVPGHRARGDLRARTLASKCESASRNRRQDPSYVRSSGKNCDAVLASRSIFVTFRAGLCKRAPRVTRKLQVPLDQNL